MAANAPDTDRQVRRTVTGFQPNRTRRLLGRNSQVNRERNRLCYRCYAAGGPIRRTRRR
jgi:hypothetical protein